MSVSTIFLQSTNEGSNEYGDTTFSIHVPAMDKSYKLQLASFMFRPKIILMENQWIRFWFDFDLVPDTDAISEETWERYIDAGLFEPLSFQYTVTVHITEPIQFNPSKTEVTQMSELIKGDLNLHIEYRHRAVTSQPWQKDYVIFTLPRNELKWELTPDYRIKLTAPSGVFASDYFTHNAPLQCGLKWTEICVELHQMWIDDISTELRYFSGLEPAELRHDAYLRTFTITAPHTYNPHYWNYITLSCNKSYNTGNVVNQERFNNDIDDSSQFYKGQILGYMPNNAYAPEAMQTGMATANEYLIQPADFNSIRFWLNYDNGEPVKLCSPMTIVLNMMPNQG